jgi:hypothetical protein
MKVQPRGWNEPTGGLCACASFAGYGGPTLDASIIDLLMDLVVMENC